MLPSLNVTSKETDVNKQFASMRSYLLTLKDEIENELSSISYNQLDADLRKRIDNMDTLVAQAKEQSDIVAQTVKANFLSADEIAARYVSTDTLTANYITASQIASSYASFGWVQALDAMVGNLNAKAITTDNLSAQQISAGQITSGTISAERINVSSLFNFGQMTSLDVYCRRILTAEIWTSTTDGHPVKWVYSGTLGGYVLMASSYIPV